MGRIEGRPFLKRKKTAILMSMWESGASGQGVGDLQEDGLEELGAAIDTFIELPELRTES